LYWLPLCPWNFQLVPLTEPHNLPGILARTVADAVVATISAAKTIRRERCVACLNQCVLFIVDFLSVGVRLDG
jgi:hypothetical protein